MASAKRPPTTDAKTEHRHALDDLQRAVNRPSAGPPGGELRRAQRRERAADRRLGAERSREASG